MSDPRSFKVGDGIISPVGYVGRVTQISKGTIYAEYPDGKGRSSFGVYTPEWFNAYDRYDLLSKPLVKFVRKW